MNRFPITERNLEEAGFPLEAWMEKRLSHQLAEDMEGVGSKLYRGCRFPIKDGVQMQ